MEVDGADKADVGQVLSKYEVRNSDNSVEH